MRPPLSEIEKEIIELAVRWRESKYAVEEAIIEKKLKHAIDMWKKEERDKHKNARTDRK